ncbi:hypothetical protein [Puia sp.]|uniref:hypothetical protein n=1 Tax=Puia sp. TaxID=2045100 RepID=UPI002F3FF21B
MKQPITNFTINGVREVKNLAMNKELIEKLRREWQETAQQTEAYPGGFNGRGIVICAGGIRYFTCAWVNIRMLRHNGCSLPIEVWYNGDELTEEVIDLLRQMQVICKNVKDHTTSDLSDYALKPFAILRSSFKEVLYLDADNNSTGDPAYLFDSDEFKATGAVFWPDFWKTGRFNPIWKVIGSKEYDSWEQESGQVLVDKEKCWREMNLCLYFNLNREHYYRMLLGDKDTFKFAWIALGSRYHMIGTPVGFCGYLDRQGVFAGLSMVQHDPEGNIIFLHRNLLKWDITQRDELVWKLIKRFKARTDKSTITPRIADREGAAGSTICDIDGEVESICFGDLFGDLERHCLTELTNLRESDFYGRFLVHSYLRYARPGYSKRSLTKS